MALLRYEPWSALNQLHGQINRYFDLEYNEAVTSAATADWVPPADIEEYKDKFVLRLDVPGVDGGFDRYHTRPWRIVGEW